jgi:Flp pilus assembly protein CpaB
MTYRVRNIVIAVVLAAMAALLTSFYVTNYKKQVQQGEELEQVWVASEDIAPGTTGDDAAKMLTSKQVATRTVVPGAISDPAEIRDKIASQPVFAGEQVTVRRFSSVSQTGPRGKLTGNLRAVQVQGSANQVLAGTLKAGDHIDVVASFGYSVTRQNPDGGSDEGDFEATRTILRDIEVLRVTGGPSPGAKLSSGLQDKFAVMLALTDAQENKLHFAMSFADDETGDEPWTFQLRPVVDDRDSPESIETLYSVLRDGLSKSQIGRLFGNYGS